MKETLSLTFVTQKLISDPDIGVLIYVAALSEEVLIQHKYYLKNNTNCNVRFVINRSSNRHHSTIKFLCSLIS
jgi:hypothetical protein